MTLFASDPRLWNRWNRFLFLRLWFVHELNHFQFYPPTYQTLNWFHFQCNLNSRIVGRITVYKSINGFGKVYILLWVSFSRNSLQLTVLTCWSPWNIVFNLIQFLIYKTSCCRYVKNPWNSYNVSLNFMCASQQIVQRTAKFSAIKSCWDSRAGRVWQCQAYSGLHPRLSRNNGRWEY